MDSGRQRRRLSGTAETYYAKKLQDGFVLLGHQMNPFPLYRQCDMVAVLSYYEGLCGVINEAKVMGKPVIATEFFGIHEQIIDGDGGLIVENSFDSIYQGMKSLLTDCNLRERLTNNHLSKQVMDDAYKLEILTGLIKD
ncbi:MAG: glycosyltransferase [Bacteroidales bacterium]|nr:glycosyltransferase [Bacteroidales bacterium]